MTPEERRIRNCEAQRRYAERNRELIRVRRKARDKRYRESHRAEVHQYQASYREANRERLSAYDKARSGTWKRRLVWHARRSPKTDPGVTLEQWVEILTLFGGACAYCLEPANSIDHMTPVAIGGAHSPDNVVPCCLLCNQRKQARTPLQWLLAGGCR